jgi:hypothetical protein
MTVPSNERLAELAAEAARMRILRNDLAACPKCRGRGYVLPRFAANHFEACQRCNEVAVAFGVTVGLGQFVSAKGIDDCLTRLAAIIGPAALGTGETEAGGGGEQ